MPSTPQFDELYRKLNAEQKRAVDAVYGPVMVLSGPGTGKTQTLAMRIANILQTTEMDPWNILCLTFTDSGVVAMRKRLFSIIGSASYYVRIHTFHSFCNDIIDSHKEIFARSNVWQLISDAERVELFRDIIDELPEGLALKPFYDPYMHFSDIMQNIHSLKQEDISPEGFSDITGSLARFVEGVAEDMDRFCALRPKERTTLQCDAMREKVVSAAKSAGLLESIQFGIMRLFDDYHEAIVVAPSSREEGKARTALKNSLQRWFRKQQGALAKQQELIEVYRAYEARMHGRGRYDYADMISMVVRELAQNDALLAHYQEQFQFILVDEYQDTNGSQNKIVELLGSFDDKPNIFVVGDDKQSIYRFQGASLANMVLFYERYKESVQVSSLTENYRSNQTILDAAHAVIENNKESLAAHIPGIASALVAKRDVPPEKLKLLAARSENDEAYAAARHIASLIQKGVSPHDIAVLYRKNSDGEDFLRMLKRLGIPARIEMGEDVFRSHTVLQWTALLSWIVSGTSEESFARILSYAWWNFSPVDVLKAVHFAGRSHLPMYAVISQEEQLKCAGVSDAQPFLRFAENLALWKKESANRPLMEFLEYILAESGFYDEALLREDSIAMLRPMKTFLEEAKVLSRSRSGVMLADFMRHISFLQEHGIALLTPSWEGGSGAVRLMTAHKAKGLEFRHVIITRLNNQHWGGKRNTSRVPLPEGLVQYDFVFADENNEDERRLFYVALTRAMEGILLTRSEHSLSGKETVQSLFVSEIPDAMLELIPQEQSSDDEHGMLAATLTDPILEAGGEDTRAYITSLLEGYCMSVTHLSNYLECPRKFYVRNVLQIPSEKSRSLALGSAFHGALRDIREEVRDSGKVPNDDWIALAYKKHVERENLSETDKKDVLARGMRALAGYMQEYRDSMDGNVLTEYNFRKHNVRIAGIPITGKIDKIEILDPDKKTINLVDYKTGNSDTWKEKMRKDGNYVRQLIFYKLLCDHAPDFPYRMASGEIDFVEPSGSGYIKKRVEISEKDAEELTKTIQGVWKDIQGLRFLDPASGCGKSDCEYCA